MDQLSEQLQLLINIYGRGAVSAVCVELLTCTCKRCGKTWSPRGATTPAQCPACKSTLWQVERAQ